MKAFARKAAVLTMALGMSLGFAGCEVDTDDDDIFKAQAEEQVQTEEA